jgi:translation elongation factor EF-1beta
MFFFELKKMKKYLFSLLLLSSLFSFGQNPKSVDKITEDVKNLQSVESINANIQRFKDSLATANYNRNNESAINSLQLESSKAAKKKAILRIAFGLGMLVILIIGLRRKTKKPLN